MTVKKLTTICVVMLVGVASVWAKPALKRPVNIVQPDGTTVTLMLHGDEYRSFTTTVDGYTVVKGEDGYYRYAQRTAEGRLAATSHIARNEAQRTAEERAFLTTCKKMQAARMSAGSLRMKQRAAAMVSPLYGSDAASRRAANIWPRINYEKFKGLVVLVNWNDCQFELGDEARNFYQRMTSEKNLKDDSKQYYPVDVEGSARDYFRDNSMGVFDPTFDVVGPVTIDYSCKYPSPKDKDGVVDEKFEERFYKILKAVLDSADTQVDFSEYDLDQNGVIDMVYMVFAGYGSYVQGNDVGYMWPHANDFSDIPSWWSGIGTYDGKRFGRYACGVEFQDYESEKAQHQYFDGIGTMCHEFSHVLGLADHYDANYEEDGLSTTPELWDVMDMGADNNYGLTPVGYSAFERHVLGFCEPTELTEPGLYSLEPLQTTNQAFLLKTGTKDDDFYLEYRKRTGWDRFLPGEGLVVWRAEMSDATVWQTNMVNTNPEHNHLVMVCNAPQDNKYIDLTPDTEPALRSWAGEPAVMGLYDINIDVGAVTFEAGNDLYPKVLEDFEDLPLTTADATGLKGKLTTWTLENATVEEPVDSMGNGQRVVKMGHLSKVTSDNLQGQTLRTLDFTIQNGGAQVRFALRGSTNGTDWTVLPTVGGKAQATTINKNASKTFHYRSIQYPYIQFMMSCQEKGKESTSACYLDDVAYCLLEPVPTAVNTIAAERRPTDGATYNLAGQRVDSRYKGLVIKNGKVVVVKR